ncbi:MAG: glycosyltransferase [Deltaproteobacteria bacterium]|nr:glycosyltransferase [Deltaproteobacteria bacterium]
MKKLHWDFMSMRVLHIYKDYFPVVGGIENHLRQLAEGLVRRGIETTVLVTSTGLFTERFKLNGVNIIKAGRLISLASTPVSLALPFILKNLTVDLVHLHFPYPVGEISRWLLKSGIPAVMTYHSDVVRQKRILKVYHKLLLKNLFDMTAVVATSHRYVQTSPYLRLVKDRVKVIPLGIDPSRFQPVPSDLINTIRGEGRLPLILFVGKLRYYKGISVLLRAMVRSSGRLIMVGEGPMEESIHADIAALGLSDRVSLVGQIHDDLLRVYFHACDMFVLPSVLRSEAFGLVLLEAMACGKPVISTELDTGTSEVNLHNITGLVVPPNDPKSLSAAINHLAGHDNLRERLGQAGKQRVLGNYTSDRMIDRTVALYQKVTQSQANSPNKRILSDP